jgi:hypothetical protein
MQEFYYTCEILASQITKINLQNFNCVQTLLLNLLQI